MDGISECKECGELECEDEYIKCSNEECEEEELCHRCLGKRIFEVKKIICPCLILGIKPKDRWTFLEMLDVKIDKKNDCWIVKEDLNPPMVKHILGSYCECSEMIMKGRTTVRDLMSWIESCLEDDDPDEDEEGNEIQLTHEQLIERGKDIIKRIPDYVGLEYLCEECCTHEKAKAKKAKKDLDAFILQKAGFKNRKEAEKEFKKARRQ